VVDAVATFDEDASEGAVFLVNRDQSESRTVTIDVRDLAASAIVEAVTLSDDDVYAKNTIDDQNRVGLVANESATLEDGRLTVVLPPVSWTAIAFA